MATNDWTLAARLSAETFGTFLLVLGGVATAVFTANFPNADTNSLGVGYLGVALAFGLTVLVGVYAVGHISGGHFNPPPSRWAPPSRGGCPGGTSPATGSPSWSAASSRRRPGTTDAHHNPATRG